MTTGNIRDKAVSLSFFGNGSRVGYSCPKYGSGNSLSTRNNKINLYLQEIFSNRSDNSQPIHDFFKLLPKGAEIHRHVSLIWSEALRYAQKMGCGWNPQQKQFVPLNSKDSVPISSILSRDDTHKHIGEECERVLTMTKAISEQLSTPALKSRHFHQIFSILSFLNVPHYCFLKDLFALARERNFCIWDSEKKCFVQGGDIELLTRDANFEINQIFESTISELEKSIPALQTIVEKVNFVTSKLFDGVIDPTHEFSQRFNPGIPLSEYLVQAYLNMQTEKISACELMVDPPSFYRLPEDALDLMRELCRSIKNNENQSNLSDRFDAFWEKIESWADKEAQAVKSYLENEDKSAALSLRNHGLSLDSTFDRLHLQIEIAKDALLGSSEGECEEKFFLRIAGSIAVALILQKKKITQSLNFVGPEHLCCENEGVWLELFRLVKLKLLSEGDEFKVSYHAGELCSAIAKPSDMHESRLRKIVENTGADRIGHATCFPGEALAETGVAIEVCPTSCENLLNQEYPIGKCITQGLPFVIATDNPDIFGCDLSSEFEKIFMSVYNTNHELKMEAIRNVIRSSTQFSHIPGESIYEVVKKDGKFSHYEIKPSYEQHLESDINGVSSSKVEVLKGTKAWTQIEVEKDLKLFELSVVEKYDQLLALKRKEGSQHHCSSESYNSITPPNTVSVRS